MLSATIPISELRAIDALLQVAESPSHSARERRLAATKVLDTCARLRSEPQASVPSLNEQAVGRVPPSQLASSSSISQVTCATDHSGNSAIRSVARSIPPAPSSSSLETSAATAANSVLATFTPAPDTNLIAQLLSSSTSSIPAAIHTAAGAPAPVVRQRRQTPELPRAA
ncbi:MAG: hypothetical protein ACREJO_03635 [Phycisphaerales bacterium]